MPVHPHACGEHHLRQRFQHCTSGSSPRLWGTYPRPTHLPIPERFIPTPVGNIPGHGYRCASYSVHPHACGEHNQPHQPILWRDGSSPRLWGTFAICEGGRQQKRFIPTPVGNIAWQPPSIGAVAVHPHACGEHGAKSGERARYRGSSPRLWGT